MSIHGRLASPWISFQPEATALADPSQVAGIDPPDFIGDINLSNLASFPNGTRPRAPKSLTVVRLTRTHSVALSLGVGNRREGLLQGTHLLLPPIRKPFAYQPPRDSSQADVGLPLSSTFVLAINNNTRLPFKMQEKFLTAHDAGCKRHKFVVFQPKAADLQDKSALATLLPGDGAGHNAAPKRRRQRLPPAVTLQPDRALKSGTARLFGK